MILTRQGPSISPHRAESAAGSIGTTLAFSDQSSQRALMTIALQK